jgi:hypothetical protein
LDGLPPTISDEGNFLRAIEDKLGQRVMRNTLYLLALALVFMGATETGTIFRSSLSRRGRSSQPDISPTSDWSPEVRTDPCGKFANQIANQLHVTVRYQASPDKIIAAETVNWGTQVATKWHEPAPES